MNMNENLTSGKLGAVVSIIRHLASHTSRNRESLEMALVNQNAVTGAAMAAIGVDTALDLGVITDDSGQLSLTNLGRKLSDADREKEKNLNHLLLLEIITRARRDLLWIGSVDSQIIRDADIELYEVMRDAGLFANRLTASAQNFWEKLGSLGQFRDNTEAKQIAGQAAEEKSFEFEVNNLLKIGRQDLAEKVKIVSANTLLGYDILSLRLDPDGRVLLKYIEVKKLSADGVSRKYFFLTKNEANQAKALGEDYIFHLWHNLDDGSTPQVITSDEILSVLPQDLNSDKSEWTECRVWI